MYVCLGVPGDDLHFGSMVILYRLPHMFANFFLTKFSNFIPLSNHIPPILHLTFNHVTFQPILQSSHLFLQKNSLNSYVSHPTLFAILIPFQQLFLNKILHLSHSYPIHLSSNISIPMTFNSSSHFQ